MKISRNRIFRKAKTAGNSAATATASKRNGNKGTTGANGAGKAKTGRNIKKNRKCLKSGNASGSTGDR